MIAALEKLKATVKARAQDYCAAIDRVIELMRAEIQDITPEKPKGQVTRPRKRCAKGNGASIVDRVETAVRDKPGQFTVTDIVTDTGLESKQVAQVLSKLSQHGLIKRIGYGKYAKIGADKEAMFRAIHAEVDPVIEAKRKASSGGDST
jgi:predicted Rossmann fold nucleotide-binding protein DprA/Smf involved in DNA uptake